MEGFWRSQPRREINVLRSSFYPSQFPICDHSLAGIFLVVFLPLWRKCLCNVAPRWALQSLFRATVTERTLFCGPLLCCNQQIKWLHEYAPRINLVHLMGSPREDFLSCVSGKEPIWSVFLKDDWMIGLEGNKMQSLSHSMHSKVWFRLPFKHFKSIVGWGKKTIITAIYCGYFNIKMRSKKYCKAFVAKTSTNLQSNVFNKS